MQANTSTSTKARRVVIGNRGGANTVLTPAQATAKLKSRNVKSVPVTKPAETETATENVANDRALARAAAAKAVAAFYAGRSLPFKSAADLKRKSPINFALNRDGSARSAALLATILTYCDVQPGSLRFVRGSGRIPGKLLGHTGPAAEQIYNAGPESGGLSNLIPDRIAYVSGPLAGAGCELAVFRINYAAARDNLRAFNTKQSDGEHLFSAPLALLDMLHDAKPAKTINRTIRVRKASAPPTAATAEPVAETPTLPASDAEPETVTTMPETIDTTPSDAPSVE